MEDESKVREAFKALPSSAQQAILDKHRWDELDYMWWDTVYDDFKEDMKSKGISVDRMYFSGFASQGDGACFEGTFSEISTFQAQHAERLKEYKAIFDCREPANEWHISWTHRGHYMHENCTYYDSRFEIDNSYFKEVDPIRYAAMQQMINEAYVKWDDFVEEVKKITREYMRELYKKLDEEHDWLTEDEQVLERLIAHELLEDEINEYTESV